MVCGNEEHKQRVNLSSLAQSVLDADRALFGDNISLSGFFNRIITAFRDKATASVDVALDARRRQLQATLSERIDNAQKDAVIDELTEVYRQDILSTVKSYPQGDSRLFRLNNRNFRLLYEEQAEQRHYASPSRYIKALLEEYARLAPAQRERIYFDALIAEVLTPAIDASYALEITLGTTVFCVRPYAVMSDEFGSHAYLVGFSRPKDMPAAEELITSIRITRIRDVVTIRRPSVGRLTIDDKRDIEQKLLEVGVQYLLGEREAIAVRLTPTGEREFFGRSHMRPRPIAVEEGGIYRFSCTTRQIKNYFISFGKEAEILSPASLREEFRAHYEDAGKLYHA